MPWLSRQNSDESCTSQMSHSNHHHPPVKPGQAIVKLIPAQIDGLCGTCPCHHKKSSLQNLRADLRIYARNIRCLQEMATPMLSDGKWRKAFATWGDARDFILQICLAVFQISMLMLLVPAFAFLPGSFFAVCMLFSWLLMKVLLLPLNGRRVIMSSKIINPLPEGYSDERWIFINGPMTSSRSMQNQCNRLAATFNRPIMGVHAPTHGVVFDILLAIFLRSFHSPTPTTRALTSHIRDGILNNSIRKTIVIGHSTGALQITLALDTLHSDLPHSVFSKLEIYTFGSFAAYLSNPCLKLETLQDAFSPIQSNFTRSDGSLLSPVKTTLESLGHRVEDRERVIPHIEHYALTSDIFARCGVLHHTKNVLDNRFCGRVFEINNIKTSSLYRGAFLLTDYLDILFPVLQNSSLHPQRSPDAAALSDNLAPLTLDTIVTVDIATAEQREFTAQGIALPLKSSAPLPMHLPQLHHHIHGMPNGTAPHSPPLSPRTRFAGNRPGSPQNLTFNGFVNSLNSGTFNSHSPLAQAFATGLQPTTTRAEKRASWGTAGAMGIDGVGKARRDARECVGRTMRQLSRLWRFEGGGRPVGEGVSVLNGMGIEGAGIDGLGGESNGLGGMVFTGEEGFGLLM